MTTITNTLNRFSRKFDRMLADFHLMIRTRRELERNYDEATAISDELLTACHDRDRQIKDLKNRLDITTENLRQVRGQLSLRHREIYTLRARVATLEASAMQRN